MNAHRNTPSALAALLLAVGMSAALVPAQIQITGAIYDGSGGPLLSGNTYQVSGDITIPAGQALTVQGGAVVKLQGGHVFVDGTLNVPASSATPAIFTCWNDQSVGLPVGTSPPAPGQWNRIDFGPNSDASTLVGAEVRHAGGSSSAAVTLDQADVTLTDCTITHSLTSGLHGNENSFPTVSGCTFSTCLSYAVTAFSFGALPGFSGNLASGIANGEYIHVTNGHFLGNLTIGPLCGMNGTGVIVIDTHAYVHGYNSLTIEAGTIIKWAGSYFFDVGGTLLSQGSLSFPVILTSLHDDSAGGDSNFNGTATVPAPGDWQRMNFSPNSNQSILDHTEVRYAGGASSGANRGALRLGMADITLNDCTISHSASDGLNGLFATSLPAVRRCSFLSCSGYAADEFALEAVPGFVDNLASGNGGDYIRVTDSTFSGSLVIGPRAGMNGTGTIVIDTPLLVPYSFTLDLLPGTTLKFTTGRYCSVYGTLNAFGTGFDPVVMTSIHDDAFGGDTNGNGAATVPSPGIWQRIEFSNNSSGLVRGLRVRYGGGYGAALWCDNSLVSLRSVRVDRSLSKGFLVSDLAGDLEDCVAFDCATVGIHLTGGSANVIHCTVAGTSGQGIVSEPAHTGGATNTISWGNAGANFSGFSPTELSHCDGDPAAAGSNGNIDADPLFADPVNGDLTLLSGSPALNAGDVAVGTALITDCVDASRRLDHDLSGNDAPDMGAYELGAWSMSVTGEPRLGTTITFDCIGPAGSAIYAMGFLDGPEILLSPFGFVTLGDPANFVLVAIGPANSPRTFQLPPPDPFWQGAPFAIQAMVLPSPGAAVGNLTQRYAGILFY